MAGRQRMAIRGLPGHRDPGPSGKMKRGNRDTNLTRTNGRR